MSFETGLRLCAILSIDPYEFLMGMAREYYAKKLLDAQKEKRKRKFENTASGQFEVARFYGIIAALQQTSLCGRRFLWHRSHQR